VTLLRDAQNCYSWSNITRILRAVLGDWVTSLFLGEETHFQFVTAKRLPQNRRANQLILDSCICKSKSSELYGSSTSPRTTVWSASSDIPRRKYALAIVSQTLALCFLSD
jgi:hypothetical protein